MRLRGKTIDAVMSVRAIRPLIGMRPDSQLELQAARTGLGSNKTQHLEVFFPLFRGERRQVLLSRFIGQPDNPHIVSRYLHKIRVRKVEVVAGDAARKVVSKSKSKVKAIKPARHEQIQI